jgi:hypothetical protein
MKSLALSIAAIAFAGAAYAQSTTVITREAPASETTVVKRDGIDGTTVTKKVESTGSVGCDTKSVTKTNEDGDRVTKTKTEC